MNKKFSIILCFVAIAWSSCNSNKAKINNNLKKFFDSTNTTGSFAILNNQMGDITVYNMELDTQRVSPGTSFNILTSLVGIQTGKITDENMVLKDSVAGNLTFTEAFRQSSVPYFQSVANAVGRDTLQFWIDSLGYGNKKLSEKLDSSWLDNDLKISPDEQLGFMNRLYFDQLPFQKYAQQMLRNAMLRTDNTMYKLSYASGKAVDENNNPIGWISGWIEENRHVYFFVTLVKSKEPNTNITETGVHITTGILKELGFFKGQK